MEKKEKTEKISTLLGAAGIILMILAAGFSMDVFGLAVVLMAAAGFLLIMGARTGGFYEDGR